jgi:hypothetical protein
MTANVRQTNRFRMGWDMKFVVGGAGKEKKKARGFADYLYSLCAGFIWLDDDEKMHSDDRTSTTNFCTTGMDWASACSSSRTPSSLRSSVVSGDLVWISIINRQIHHKLIQFYYSL